MHLYAPDTSVRRESFLSLLIWYGNFCFCLSCNSYSFIFIRVYGEMGEWPNNLRSQLTQLQNNDETGAVLGKKKKHYFPS